MNIIVRRIAQLALFAALALNLSQPAEAQVLAALPHPSAPAVKLGEARPIAAWVDFCRRYRGECDFDMSEPAEITLTAKAWQTLNSVNRRVNTTIRPMTDQEHWGIPDQWDLPNDGFGDCEDFQLLKRKLLTEQGFSRRAMRMTVVLDEKNEGHAVLMVRTDRGDLILDNKINAVVPWTETGYIYVKRESQDAIAWVSLGGAVSPVSTANR